MQSLSFYQRPLQPVAAGAQCLFQLYLIQQQSQGDQVRLVGDKMVVEQCSNTGATHFLSRCRAHLKQPEGREGKRLRAGKTWGKQALNIHGMRFFCTWLWQVYADLLRKPAWGHMWGTWVEMRVKTEMWEAGHCHLNYDSRDVNYPMRLLLKSPKLLHCYLDSKLWRMYCNLKGRLVKCARPVNKELFKIFISW